MKTRYIHIINFDGRNVGCKDAFAATWLSFDSFEDALAVYNHWNDWICL